MPKTCSEPAAPCQQRTTLHGPSMGTRWSVSADVGASVNLAALRQDLAAAVQQVRALMFVARFAQDVDRRRDQLGQ